MPSRDVPTQNVVAIPDLLEGICVDYLHLKIEKVIIKQVFRYPLGKAGPSQPTEHLQLVVFDKSVCRVSIFIFCFVCLCMYCCIHNCFVLCFLLRFYVSS